MAKYKINDLPYNPKLKERAKELRKAGNLAEVLLWNQIKGRQINNLQFNRQVVIGNYIVDFYNSEKGIVIEIDGGSHNEKVEYDAVREAFLQGLGLTVIHISDTDVKKNMNEVLRFIESKILEINNPPQ